MHKQKLNFLLHGTSTCIADECATKCVCKLSTSHIPYADTVNKQAIDDSNTVLGLTCDPFGTNTDFDVYVHHSTIYQTDQLEEFPVPPNEFLSYKGFISKISFADQFETLQVGIHFAITNSTNFFFLLICLFLLSAAVWQWTLLFKALILRNQVVLHTSVNVMDVWLNSSVSSSVVVV